MPHTKCGFVQLRDTGLSSKAQGRLRRGTTYFPLSPSETLIANALNSATEQFIWHGILIMLEGRASGGETQAPVSLPLFTFTISIAGKCQLALLSYYHSNTHPLLAQKGKTEHLPRHRRNGFNTRTICFPDCSLNSSAFPGALGSLKGLDIMTHLSGCHRNCQKSPSEQD